MIKQNDLSQDLYLLKNTKALNLKRYRYLPRIKEENALYSFKGLSSDSFSNKWFLIGDKQSIFKTFDDPLYPEIRDKRILNEMICFRLAEKLNINAAPCQPAIYDKYSGIVSYSFLKDGDTMINGEKILAALNGYLVHDNAFDNFLFALPEYADKNALLLDNDIELDLFKIMIFDFLTIEEDRHLGNIVFIKDKNDTLRLAPLFDNEFAFAIAEKLSKKEYFNHYDALVGCARMRPYSGSKKSVRGEAVDILKVAQKDTRYLDFLKNVTQFDIKAFFEDLDKEISINEEYKKECIECFEFGQNALKMAFRESGLDYENAETDENDNDIIL